MNTLLQFLAKHGPQGTQKFLQRYTERSELLQTHTLALNEFNNDYANAMKSNDPELVRRVLLAGQRAAGTYQKETQQGLSQLNNKLKALEENKTRNEPGY